MSALCEYLYYSPDQDDRTERPRQCSMPCGEQFCARHARFFSQSHCTPEEWNYQNGLRELVHKPQLAEEVPQQ